MVETDVQFTRFGLASIEYLWPGAPETRNWKREAPNARPPASSSFFIDGAAGFGAVVPAGIGNERGDDAGTVTRIVRLSLPVAPLLSVTHSGAVITTHTNPKQHSVLVGRDFLPAILVALMLDAPRLFITAPVSLFVRFIGF
ncbi:MAG TPA: hypothetical protein VKA81_05180 [Verrucomicrobiae bacterium]|nr:hypothetical protein [Verrucomicrobiae bacterium]